MATIAPVINPSKDHSTTVTWSGFSTADTATAFTIPEFLGVIGSVQMEGTWGTATIIMQVSNDGTNWAPLSDTVGNAISDTDGGNVFEFSTAAKYIRPSSSGGTADNVEVIMVLRG